MKKERKKELRKDLKLDFGSEDRRGATEQRATEHLFQCLGNYIMTSSFVKLYFIGKQMTFVFHSYNRSLVCVHGIFVLEVIFVFQ